MTWGRVAQEDLENIVWMMVWKDAVISSMGRPLDRSFSPAHSRKNIRGCGCDCSKLMLVVVVFVFVVEDLDLSLSWSSFRASST